MDKVKNEDRDLKLRILEASRAIRKKHIQLKSARADTDQLLRKTFKPITKPLEELDTTLKQGVQSIKEPLLEMVTKLEPPSDNQSVSSPQKTLSVSQSRDVSPLHEYLYKFHILPRTYIRDLFYDSSNTMDTAFGPTLDVHLNSFKVGNSIINFSDADIKINDKVYKGTPGLYELLFKKHPNMYTQEDKDAYRDILENSHVLHRNFNPKEQLRGNKSYKYNNIIKPLLEQATGQGYAFTSGTDAAAEHTYRNVIKPQKENHLSGKGHMTFSNSPYQYVYWDNVNELVDRLRLLMASQTAGNNSHKNEIMSILDELREAGVIE